MSAQYFHSVSATDNYVKCPCNNFIKRHFNQYFVNNNNNNNKFTGPDWPPETRDIPMNGNENLH